jgi:hypothetical protein
MQACSGIAYRSSSSSMDTCTGSECLAAQLQQQTGQQQIDQLAGLRCGRFPG